eukprot:Sdes_comp23408_c0_seq1m21660
MNYELYRRSTLGVSLNDSLDELSHIISPQLASKVLNEFDKSINENLSKLGPRIKTNFKGKLHTYRFYDNVWTFILEDATFKCDGETIVADKVKIVACDGKMTSTS